MAPSIRLILLLGVVAPALGQVTSAATSVAGLFVMETPVPASEAIYASIIDVDPALSRTTYYINCHRETSGVDRDEWFGRPHPPPCNHIDGASVTIDPTAMTLNLRRQSQVIDGRATDGEVPAIATKETLIFVRATATCTIDGTMSASCTGHMYSTPTVVTYTESSTWGMSSTTQTETISTAFADVGSHTISVTLTGGLEKLAAATITTSLSWTRSSTNGVAMATGKVQIGMVAAVLGGVAVLV